MSPKVVEYGFMFLKAFFTQDTSEIENYERFIGLFYKDPEPTSNDVPDPLEVKSFENAISEDTPLGSFARTRKKIKRKIALTVLTESYFERASLCR
ncbi:MAG: hypothetical protein SPL31_00405 [Succinivibrio sp.]|nr:hypothetical protein [Succinivibrio sp.]